MGGHRGVFHDGNIIERGLAFEAAPAEDNINGGIVETSPNSAGALHSDQGNDAPLRFQGQKSPKHVRVDVPNFEHFFFVHLVRLDGDAECRELGDRLLIDFYGPSRITPAEQREGPGARCLG